jgi:hypothetical protein
MPPQEGRHIRYGQQTGNQAGRAGKAGRIRLVGRHEVEGM